MDKQNVVYTYNGILFSLKKEWNSDTLQHGQTLRTCYKLNVCVSRKFLGYNLIPGVMVFGGRDLGR